MIKTKYSDFTSEEIEYVLKLLKKDTPMSVIRKKTRLNHNEILAIIAKNRLPFNRSQLAQYSIEDDTVIFTSDNHKGNKHENKRYEKLIQSYARTNNIKTIVNCGDEIQSNIEPLRYDVYGQIGAYLSVYPGKSITTYYLGGNHERNAIERCPEVYDSLKSRRDVKFLGLGSAYILWQNQLILLHHTIPKFDLEIPFYPYLERISGHHHFFKITSDGNIYLPTSSDDIKKVGAVPGFVVGKMSDNKLYFEHNTLGNDIEENGVKLTKKII